MEQEKRFYLDNINRILDMKDKRDKYNLEYEEVVNILNELDEKTKILREANNCLKQDFKVWKKALHNLAKKFVIVSECPINDIETCAMMQIAFEIEQAKGSLNV